QTARWIAWPACLTLVFLSAFILSGTRQPPLELDPSWHAALEYSTAHHLQFGTQIVFTFGPLGFLAAPTSLGHLLGARIAFAFFWSALVALLATALARRLPRWVRYAFLTWLVVFTLSAGLGSLAVIVVSWVGQRKILKAMVLALAAPAGFVAGWVALGQSLSHLAP